jgi:hypothetical protein
MILKGIYYSSTKKNNKNGETGTKLNLFHDVSFVMIIKAIYRYGIVA